MLVARRRPVMSDALKYEIAKDLGVAEIVSREGWGNVSSRQCGSMVKKAIQKANALQPEHQTKQQ